MTHLNRTSEANAKRVPIDHKLGTKRIRPIARNFVRQLSVHSIDELVEEQTIQRLETPFEEVYNVFEKATTAGIQTQDKKREFEQFMQNFVRVLIQHKEIQKILSSGHLSMSAHSDQTPSSNQALEIVNKNSASRPIPEIELRLGDSVQSMKIDPRKVHVSKLKRVNREEDTPAQFDATIWISEDRDTFDEKSEERFLGKIYNWFAYSHKGKISATILIATLLCGILEGTIHLIEKFGFKQHES